MFELGMRVAFQKPVIVIVDDATDFSFDISPLRHIIYRRDREYKSIVAFKSQLVEALRNVDNLTGYLSQFGDIHVSNIGDRTVSIEEMAKGLFVMVGQIGAIDRKINEVIQSNLIDRNKAAHDDLIGTSRPLSAAGGALVTRDMIEAARNQLDLTAAARNAARASAKVSQQIAKGLDPLDLKLG